jgi:hypothetical protein
MITVLLSPSSVRPMTLRFSHRRLGLRALASTAFLLGTFSSPALAQSAQKYALQIAVLSTSINSGDGSSSISGAGLEPQIRFNRLVSKEGFAVSLGLGAQYTRHSSGGDDLNISGAFLEPRFVPVIGSSNLFPYVSGRLALLRQSSNFGTSSNGYAYGAGGGIVIKLSKTVNLDAGAQLVRQKFGEFVFNDGDPAEFLPFTTYAAKIGLNFGFPR